MKYTRIYRQTLIYINYEVLCLSDFVTCWTRVRVPVEMHVFPISSIIMEQFVYISALEHCRSMKFSIYLYLNKYKSFYS